MSIAQFDWFSSTFYKAFFITGGNSQSGTAGLLPGMGTEAILDGDLTVVEEDHDISY